MFGGIGILRGLVAALGAALFVGNAMALMATRRPSSKPPSWSQRQQRQPRRRINAEASGPVRRLPLIAMTVLGLLIFLWAIASMFTEGP